MVGLDPFGFARKRDGFHPRGDLGDQRLDIDLREQADMAIVLVEQYFSFAYDLGDRFYVLERGAVKMSGPKAELDRDALLAGVSV